MCQQALALETILRVSLRVNTNHLGVKRIDTTLRDKLVQNMRIIVTELFMGLSGSMVATKEREEQLTVVILNVRGDVQCGKF